MNAPSLSRRLVGYLLVTQLFAFSIAWAITIPLGLAGVEAFSLTLDEIATGRAVNEVRDSLVRDDGGRLRIEPNAKLREELRRADDAICGL